MIKIIVKIIRDRYPWLAARIDLTFKGHFTACVLGKPTDPVLTGLVINNFSEELREFLEIGSGSLFEKIIRINDIEKLQRFQSLLSRQLIVMPKQM